MPLSKSAQEHITKLQQLYIASMLEKHSEVTTNWMLADQQNWQGESIERLLRGIHRLAYSAAAFGFPDISAMAREVESLLTQGVVTETLTEVRHKLQALCGLLTVYAYATEAHHKPQALVPATWLQPLSHKQVLLIDHAQHLSRLIEPLEKSGYTVENIGELNALRHYMNHNTPSLMVLDGAFNLLDTVEFSDFMQYVQQQQSPPALLYLLHVNDLPHRLQAVRFGAKRCLMQPVARAQFLESVEVLLIRPQTEPYRVLLLEEDPDLANLYQTSLEQAGIHIQRVSDPHAMLEAMIEFKPELILLDSIQPNCLGIELAILLRQDEAYLNVSLLLLTIAAQQIPYSWTYSSDQILIKPIPLDYFVELVLHKLQSHRKLQHESIHDSLTGLLTEGGFRDRLQANIALAERSGSPVTVAVLDIVQFKQVNQQYSYWIGDQLLKNIAKMLRQRLRRGDLIGRSQDNLFLIALYDADETSARQVLQQLLQEVNDQVHIVGEKQTLHLQWHIGIAHYLGYINSLGELNFDMLAVAVAALKTAKQQGVNQMVLRSITNTDFLTLFK